MRSPEAPSPASEARPAAPAPPRWPTRSSRRRSARHGAGSATRPAARPHPSSRPPPLRYAEPSREQGRVDENPVVDDGPDALVDRLAFVVWMLQQHAGEYERRYGQERASEPGGHGVLPFLSSV